MPWLQSQIAGSGRALALVPERVHPDAAVLSVARDDPVRRYSRHTHVRTNDDGRPFDETQTIATWLHDAGYFTGLIGKYLNRYPFGRGPYIPPGWDRWVVKRNTAATTTYYDFGFVDQGVALQTSDAPATYATDLFADHAVDFLRTAPDDRPFFLYFATSAPHPPWTPPIRHAGAFAGVPIPRRRASTSATCRTSPRGCRSCAGRRRRSSRAARGPAARGGDAARRGRCRRAIVGRSRAGRPGRTVIMFLTDNGYSFGEHRIRGKRCPYEECIRTPFAARGARGAGPRRARSHLERRSGADDRGSGGRDARAAVDGRSSRPRSSAADGGPRPACSWNGRATATIPAWQGVRTTDFAYIENADGTVELYDLTGRSVAPILRTAQPVGGSPVPRDGSAARRDAARDPLPSPSRG